MQLFNWRGIKLAGNYCAGFYFLRINWLFSTSKIRRVGVE